MEMLDGIQSPEQRKLKDSADPTRKAEAGRNLRNPVLASASPLWPHIGKPKSFSVIPLSASHHAN